MDVYSMRWRFFTAYETIGGEGIYSEKQSYYVERFYPYGCWTFRKDLKCWVEYSLTEGTFCGWVCEHLITEEQLFRGTKSKGPVEYQHYLLDNTSKEVAKEVVFTNNKNI